AGTLGKDVDETAYAIMVIANELMIKAIGEITVNDGLNPRESVIVAGGGAAGFNIMPIAQELGCDTVILPRTASALSACGMQYSSIVFEATRSRFTDSNNFDREGANRALDEIEAELMAFRDSLGTAKGAHVDVEFFVEARYRAQVWELDTALPKPRLVSDADVDELVETFHQTHERIYAVRDEGSPVECVNWKGRISIRPFDPPPAPEPASDNRTPDAPSTRECFFGGAARVDTPIFRGPDLVTGDTVEGPAIIEEPTTTIVVYPGMSARLSAADSYILDCR
ncbi:MAG: hydantoinase/oxoprolinase family protein, partial [Alphaproteobacteria bacterium]|nr:hydantoinase/oxoprolinase family protein [Alphaproteobacteria bacterium]